MHFSCPECGKPLKVRHEMAGKKGRCPACKATVVVPAPAASAVKGSLKKPPEPPPLTAPEYTFEIEQENRHNPKWRLSIFRNRLSFNAHQGDGFFEVPRTASVDRLRTTCLFFVPPILTIKRDKKKLSFKLTAEAYAAINRWIGKAALLKTTLKQRFSWCLPIGILYLLGSIPMPSDPEAGFDAIPFDPFGAALGAILILLSILMKIKPHPALFLADSAWFGLLSIYTVWQIVNGASMYWLIAVALQFMLMISGISHYHNFVDLTDLPVKAGEVSS